MDGDGELCNAIELLVKDTRPRSQLAVIKRVLLKSLVFGIAEQLPEFRSKYGNPLVVQKENNGANHFMETNHVIAGNTSDPKGQFDKDLMKQLSPDNVSFDFSG